MATGRKELSLFKRMTMEARIKFSHLLHKVYSFSNNVVRKTFRAPVFKSFSNLHHYFAMRFFNPKQRIYFWKKKVKQFTSCRPAVCGFFKFSFANIFISRITTLAKSFIKPFNENFLIIGNRNQCMKLLTAAVFALFYISYIKTPFSINDSRKICKIGNRLVGSKKFIFCHKKSPYVGYSSIINENNNNVQRDRLNKETHYGMRKSELVSKVREENPKSFSRLEIGHKSNSLVLNEAAARLGQSMRETEDELCRDMLAGTASVINCTNGVNGDNPTEITRADIDNVVATLQNNDADFMTNMIGGEDKFGTGPVRDAYFGLCDTRMIGQLENANGFINKAQYPNQTGVMSSEWGSIGNVRFYLSSRGSVTVGASMLTNDIYNVFIGGQESYAKVEQNGVSARFIYHPPGHGDDPAELRQTAAWRMAQVPRITNDAWIISLRCTLG